MGYLTLNEAPVTTQCLALFVPDSLEALAIVRGALLELLKPENWDKYGALSQQESANVFFDMADRFCAEKASCRVIGELIAWAGETSPNPNWLVCDGSLLAIADYPDLYGVIGITYGRPSAGHFYLPNLARRSPAGADPGASTSPLFVGQEYGQEKHALSIAEMPAHSHTDSGHTHTTGNSLSSLAVMPGEGPVLVPNPIPAISGSGSANISSVGGGDEFNVTGLRLVVNWLIVARDG